MFGKKQKSQPDEVEPDKRLVDFLYENEYIRSLRDMRASRSIIKVAAHSAVELALVQNEVTGFDPRVAEFLDENPEIARARADDMNRKFLLEIGVRAMDGALDYVAKEGFFPDSAGQVGY